MESWKLLLESTFAIKEVFSNNKATSWAVEELKRRGLKRLFKPVASTAYERLVREFYKKKRNEEKENEEFQDARAGNGEHRRMYELDFTTALHELFAPTAVSTHSCIVLPPTNATHYDIKPHVIQMLPSFYGLDHENPYSHVKKFKSITATTKFQKFSEESVNLRLFPFSLHDRATEWLDSLAPRSITS
jgi:hypothetical protein